MNTVFRLGDSGPAVAQITGLLQRIGLLGDGVVPPAGHHTPDATYDERVELAVRTFQQQRGLTVDGIVGPLTFRRLDEARWPLGDRILTHLPGNLMVGDDVYALQRRLLDLGFQVGRVDGYFGPETEAGVREFQRNVGIPPDGTCGPATLKALARLAPMVSGGAPNAMRAQERIRDAGPHLGGKIVVIDVGRGHNLPPEHAEASDAILHDLAQRVEGRLVATGVQAFLTTPRWAAAPGEEVDRAAFANRTGADLFLSLALDASDEPDACGVSTYFFGDANHDTWSSAGERFAGLVQREIVARSDLVDLRWHPKTWDLLRHDPDARRSASTPATSPTPVTRARLRDPAFRDVLAEAVVVAVQRFYLSPDVDSPTGVLDDSASCATASRAPDAAGHGGGLGAGRPGRPRSPSARPRASCGCSWDPFIRHQHLIEAERPAKGVQTLTKARVGPTMISQYVSYRPPTSVGMTMVQGAVVLRLLRRRLAVRARGARRSRRDEGGLEVHLRGAGRRWLRRVAEPIGQWLLGREIRARIAAFAKACRDPGISGGARRRGLRSGRRLRAGPARGTRPATSWASR